MYAHDLRDQEIRRLRRRPHDGPGRTLAGLAQGLSTARALPAGQRDFREPLCPPRE